MRFLFFSLVALACFACSPNTAIEEVVEPVMPPPAPTSEVVVTSYPAQCWLDRSLLLSQYDDARLQEIAQCDMAMFPLFLLYSEEARGPIARIRGLNPDIVLIGGLTILSWLEVMDSPGARERFPLQAKLNDLYRDRVAWTTEGRVAYTWPEQPTANPIRDGKMDRALLDRVVNLVSQGALDYPGVMDGIFHDFLAPRPYLFGGDFEPDEDTDLDGDGRGTREDSGENEIWLRWQLEYLREFQERFGVGLIQIGNGRLPLTDDECASRLSGIALEAFPNLVWGYTDLEGFDAARVARDHGRLVPRRGRTWSLLWDRTGIRLNVCRYASLLQQEFYAMRDNDQNVQRDPEASTHVADGGSMIMEDLPSGSRSFRRSYGGEIIEMRFDANGSLEAMGSVEN